MPTDSVTMDTVSCTLVLSENGQAIQTCGCAWDRLLWAQVDLLISGEIDFHDPMLDRLQLSDKPTECPSANHAARMILLAHDEPQLTDTERRMRLWELLNLG